MIRTSVENLTIILRSRKNVLTSESNTSHHFVDGRAAESDRNTWQKLFDGRYWMRLESLLVII